MTDQSIEKYSRFSSLESDINWIKNIFSDALQSIINEEYKLFLKDLEACSWHFWKYTRTGLISKYRKMIKK